MAHARTIGMIAAASLLSFGAGAAAMRAQERAQASHREPQFDNAEMTSWKSVIMPKQPLTYHRHDHGRAIIALTDGTLDLADKSGKRLDEYHWKAGHAYWLGKDPPGQMHADVNNTTKPIEVIVVELKNDK